MHALYERADVREAVRRRLGDDVLDAEGGVDRRRVAAAVFGDAPAIAWLEGLLHPLVREEAARRMDEAARSEPPPPLIVHEVPLLFEARLEGRYDRTLVVTAPAGLRARRLALRGGLEALAAREARLLPEAEKLARADDVLVNDGDREELDRQVAAYVARHGRPCG